MLLYSYDISLSEIFSIINVWELYAFYQFRCMHLFKIFTQGKLNQFSDKQVYIFCFQGLLRTCCERGGPILCGPYATGITVPVAYGPSRWSQNVILFKAALLQMRSGSLLGNSPHLWTHWVSIEGRQNRGGTRVGMWWYWYQECH